MQGIKMEFKIKRIAGAYCKFNYNTYGKHLNVII